MWAWWYTIVLIYRYKYLKIWIFWLFSERPCRNHGIINIELLQYCNPKPVLQIAIDDQFYCIGFLSFIKQKITCALPMRIKSEFVQKNRCGNLDMFRWNFLKLCIHLVHFYIKQQFVKVPRCKWNQRPL
jgi:hypothetical protein